MYLYTVSNVRDVIKYRPPTLVGNFSEQSFTFLFLIGNFKKKKKVFVGPRSILWGHWCPLFQTSDDSAHEFQSQGGSVIACALLSLVCNDPQSHLWLPGLGIEPRSPTLEESTIPLHQPDPAKLETYVRANVKNLGSRHPWSAIFRLGRRL